MKQQDITLRLTLRDDEPLPDEWDWPDLLDLAPGEDVRVVSTSHITDVPSNPLMPCGRYGGGRYG